MIALLEYGKGLVRIEDKNRFDRIRKIFVSIFGLGNRERVRRYFLYCPAQWNGYVYS